MKVLIASDNHRDVESLNDLVHIYKDEIDLWLHCGDSEFGSDHSIWQTFKTVKGNMDWEHNFSEVLIEEYKGTTFGVVHGHHHQVRQSMEPMAEVAHDNNVDIMFYGHTHIAKVDQLDDLFFINPGSIAQPRGLLRVGSYAIYEENEDGQWITFYDWNHNELTELSQKLK